VRHLELHNEDLVDEEVKLILANRNILVPNHERDLTHERDSLQRKLVYESGFVGPLEEAGPQCTMNLDRSADYLMCAPIRSRTRLVMLTSSVLRSGGFFIVLEIIMLEINRLIHSEPIGQTGTRLLEI
jgi:hypothetical protein